MRLNNNLGSLRPRRRRGLSFVETVISIVILTMIIGMTLGIMSVLTRMTQKTKDFSELRVYEITKLAKIRDDLEMSMNFKASPIDMVDYSEVDTTAKIKADIEIYSVGEVFGEDLYIVKMNVMKTDSGSTVTSHTLLRGGCVANDT